MTGLKINEKVKITEDRHRRYNVLSTSNPSWRSRRSSLLQDSHVDRYCTLTLTLTFWRTIHCFTSFSSVLKSLAIGRDQHRYMCRISPSICPPSCHQCHPHFIVVHKGSILWQFGHCQLSRKTVRRTIDSYNFLAADNATLCRFPWGD